MIPKDFTEFRPHRDTDSSWSVWATDDKGKAIQIVDEIPETLARRVALCMRAFEGIGDNLIPDPPRMLAMFQLLSNQVEAHRILSAAMWRPNHDFDRS